MQIRVSYSGRPCERPSVLPSALHLDERATLAQAVNAIERQMGHDNLLPPTSHVAVNGNHAGTVAVPDHRELHDGDEISLFIPGEMSS